MKKYTLIVLAIALLAFVGLQAQNKSEPGAYEYAIVKWDGPDRLYYNLPQSFVLVHVRSQGVTIPKDAQEEEWCLTYAANQLAKEGWETLTLDSRRIVLRRAKR